MRVFWVRVEFIFFPVSIEGRHVVSLSTSVCKLPMELEAAVPLETVPEVQVRYYRYISLHM